MAAVSAAASSPVTPRDSPPEPPREGRISRDAATASSTPTGHPKKRCPRAQTPTSAPPRAASVRCPMGESKAASVGSELLGVVAVRIGPHSHGDGHRASPRVTDGTQFFAFETFSQEAVTNLHSGRDEGEHVA